MLQCERMLEQYEERIEDWYFHQQDKKVLMDYLCRDTVLNKDNQCEYWRRNLIAATFKTSCLRNLS